MGVSGKTRAERSACEDAGTKVRRLIDTLATLKQSADELGKLRDKYAGGGIITATDAEGLGTIHAVMEEVFFERETGGG